MARTFLAALVTLCLPLAAAETVVFHRGHVHVLDKKGARADWLAVEGGKVVGYGLGDHHRAYPAAKRVDLQGRHVLPSLTDAHAHVSDVGRAAEEIDLHGTRSAEEAVERVARAAAAHRGEKGALVGNGWDQSDWPGQRFPTRAMLDRVAPERPVVLYRVDGHAAWVNTAALRRSGLWDGADAPGGRVVRDELGRPTGVLVDGAMAPVAALADDLTEAQQERAIETAVRKFLAAGITGVHDAGSSPRQIETKRRLLKSGRVRFRFYEMVSAGSGEVAEAALEERLARGPETGAENGQLTVRAVKLFADGAMGSRGALFEAAYDDEPGTHGLWVTPYEKLVTLMKKIDARGFQIAVHAIGSLANRKVLDAFVTVLGDRITAARPRLEHAQVLEPADVKRIGRLGVIASMQPSHCTSDMKWVVARIGEERAKGAYAWRSLADAGATLAFGSDAPVEPVNPWPGIHAAVTRQDAKGRPAGGFHPEQRLTREEAYRAFTAGGAYASFTESEQGSLEPGRWADFIVVDEDPFRVPLGKLRDLQVRATYVGGEQAWPRIVPEMPAGPPLAVRGPGRESEAR